MGGGSRKNKNATKKAKKLARKVGEASMAVYDIAMHSDYAMEPVPPDEEPPSVVGRESSPISVRSRENAGSMKTASSVVGQTESSSLPPLTPSVSGGRRRQPSPGPLGVEGTPYSYSNTHERLQTQSAPASVGPSPQYKINDHGSELPSSSPYPEPSSQVSEMPEAQRLERRAEKSRRARADSIESDDLKKAVARSMKDIPNSREQSELPPTTWVDGNIKAAYETLGRERAVHEDTEEFNKRHAALRRALKSLTDLRVAEDGQMAQEVYEKMLAEEQKAEYIQEAARIDASTARASRPPAPSPTPSRSMEREEKQVRELEKIAASQRAALESKKSSRSGDTSSTQGRAAKVPLPPTATSKTSSKPTRSEGSESRPTTTTQSSVVRGVHRGGSNVRQFLTPKSALSAAGKQSETSVANSASPKHGWYDRIVLQRVRGEEIAAKGWSGLKDQGIGWDEHGQAFELRSAPSRGSSVGTMGGTRRMESQELGTPFAESSISKKKETLMGRPMKVSNSSPNDGYYSRPGTAPTVPHASAVSKPGVAGGAGQPDESSPSDSSTETESSVVPTSKGKEVPEHTGNSRSSRAVTIEEVDDVDDPEHVHKARAVQKAQAENRRVRESYAERSSDDSIFIPNERDDTDSVWDQDPQTVVQEVTHNAETTGGHGIIQDRVHSAGTTKVPIKQSASASQPKKGKGPSAGPSKQATGQNAGRDRQKAHAGGAAAGAGGGPSGNESTSGDDTPPKNSKGFTPRRNPSESERSRKKRMARNSRRNHHPAAWKAERLHLVEPGLPGLAGNAIRQQQKWVASLHAPIIKYYEEMLANPCSSSSLFDEFRMLRIPAPEKYAGTADLAAFESHVSGVCRWMNITGMAGPEPEERRMLVHSFQLTGAAKQWYETEVNVAGKHFAVGRLADWLRVYLEMLLEMFDRFVDTAAVQHATEKFWHTKYSPDIGVTGFYNELMAATNRMIQRPDSFTFKNQFMTRLPEKMVRWLIARDVTAEYTGIRVILQMAVNYEWQEAVLKRYTSGRANGGDSRRAGAGYTPPSRSKEEHHREMAETEEDEPPPNAEAPQMNSARVNREELKRRVFHMVKRNDRNANPVFNRKPFVPKGGYKGGGGAQGQASPRQEVPVWPKPGEKSAPKGLKCFTCGGNHYRDQCPQNKQGVAMFAAQPIVNDNENSPEKGGTSEQLRQTQEVEDDGYTSEGGYTWAELSEYSENEGDERIAHIAEREDEERPPSMYADSSDEESENEEDEMSTRQTKLDESVRKLVARAMSDSRCESDELPRSFKFGAEEPDAGLFRLCNQYSEDKFGEEPVSERQLDQLAKEMAQHIVRQGDTREVEEFLFATGDRASLSQKTVGKRSVHLKRSKEVQVRPPRTKADNFCLTAYVNIHGRAAFTLFDSGCTTEAISPDFTRVAGITVFPIQSAITLQLGTAGSRSKINHGTNTMVEYAHLKSKEYLDIVNLDKFDAIVGTKYMRKHGIALDFEYNVIRIKGVPTPTLTEHEETSEVERRNAARRIDE
ncbi:hypothetical protein C8R43DRAFT_953289 [Mycena crocata]|nr:hypothetical protein C8R43DRAFT_953289 [Mycena crocata]